jgi:hypothetical protein
MCRRVVSGGGSLASRAECVKAFELLLAPAPVFANYAAPAAPVAGLKNFRSEEQA